MKLWLLRPTDEGENGPWDPWYDKSFGYVVRAESEAHARALAKADEQFEPLPWDDAMMARCEELTVDGDAEIVLRDFHAA